MEIVRDLISLGLKITVDGDCSPEIKRHFFAPWKKNYDKLGQHIKNQRLLHWQRSIQSKLWFFQ